MSELKSLVPKPDRRLLPAPPHTSQEPKQRRMMVIALTLLLVALGFVLYHDRDFWFPETQEAEDQPQARPATKVAAQPPVVSKSTPQVGKSRHRGAVVAKTKPPDPATAAPSDPPFATATRTVLPPLEVEVVAGNVHRSVRPGTNSVRVDLQPGSPAQSGSPAQTVAQPTVVDNETAASVTNVAAERVQMSADTADVVSRPVKPGYPLLARQMKVQGSVILQALIGRDGLIQDLRVVSGPPILANAAQEAVKQWHFKPHYQGPDAVETQARITVNFTISTN
jgi:protein TonB